MGTGVIVKFQVKESAQIDGKKISVSEDFYTELEKKVKTLIDDACKRAKSNNRNTVMGRDV